MAVDKLYTFYSESNGLFPGSPQLCLFVQVSADILFLYLPGEFFIGALRMRIKPPCKKWGRPTLKLPSGGNRSLELSPASPAFPGADYPTHCLPSIGKHPFLCCPSNPKLRAGMAGQSRHPKPGGAGLPLKRKSMYFTCQAGRGENDILRGDDRQPHRPHLPTKILGGGACLTKQP